MASYSIPTVALALSLVLGLTASQAEDAKPQTPAFLRPQSAIKGLLVRELSAGNYAGMASQMNCTAISGNKPAEKSVFTFNQKVGDDMTKALGEVVKHSTVMRGDLPLGMKVEFAFEDKFGAKDGPSAAVACALMLDSLRTGADIDSHFAVTGDLNADGNVQPVGGVPDKIRGAAARSCNYVGVPTSAERELTDAITLDGLTGLWEIQVFSIKTYEDALALSSTAKAAPLKEAISTFAEVQAVLQTQKNPALLANPKVQARLAAVLKAAPNCLSAKLLLNYGQGKHPKILSLGGSLGKIDSIASDLVKHLKDPKAEGVAPDLLAKVLGDLGKVRTRLNPNTVAFADAIKNYGDTFRAIKANPPRSPNETDKARARMDAAVSRINIEEDKIHSNKALMEEVMSK